jgi:hypothetical protein
VLCSLWTLYRAVNALIFLKWCVFKSVVWYHIVLVLAAIFFVEPKCSMLAVSNGLWVSILIASGMYTPATLRSPTTLHFEIIDRLKAPLGSVGWEICRQRRCECHIVFDDDAGSLLAGAAKSSGSIY